MGPADQKRFDGLCLRPVCDEHIQAVVHAGAGAVQAGEFLPEQTVYLVQVHPVAVDLQEAFFPAGDVVIPVLVELCHIAGAEDAAPFVSPAQVLFPLRVAHGHIRALVNQLSGDAGGGDGPVLPVEQAEGPAGDGDAHGAAFLHRLLRRQIAHPGGGLALAVHDHEAPVRRPGLLRELPVQRRGELAPRLGHGPQGGQVHPVEAHPVQHFIGIGHAAQGGGSGLFEEVPEFPLHQGFLRDQQRPAGEEVAVDDGEAVGVVHGQGGDGALLPAQLQIGRDGLRVGADVPIALPDEFRAPGGAGGGQQQGQVRVEGGIVLEAGFQEAVAEGLEDRRCIREVLRGPQVGGAVGLQEGRQGFAVRLAAQQQGDDSGVQEAGVADYRAGLVPAEEKGQAAAACRFRHALAFLGQGGVGQSRSVFVQYGGSFAIFF